MAHPSRDQSKSAGGLAVLVNVLARPIVSPSVPRRRARARPARLAGGERGSSGAGGVTCSARLDGAAPLP